MSNKNMELSHKNENLRLDFKYHLYTNEEDSLVGLLFSNICSNLHTHTDFAEFSLITSGEWKHEYNGATHILKKNDLIFLGKNTAHNLIPCSLECSHFTFYFKEEYLKEIVAKFFPTNRNIITTKFKRNTLAPSVSSFLLHEAHKMASKHANLTHEIEVQNYMHNVIYFMFFDEKVPAVSSSKNAHADRLRTFLDNYLYLDEPMKHIYSMFPISPATLIKHFENETGQTIAQYRSDKRMEYASLLLRDHKMTIAAAANQVGISNPSHFAKEFKKMFGITPSEFSKQNRMPQ